MYIIDLRRYGRIIISFIIVMIAMCHLYADNAYADTFTDRSGKFECSINTGQSSCTITGYLASDTDLTIPSLLYDSEGNNYSVTAISDCAFSNCSSLKAISIPENVTSIGAAAFANCSSLETISIPENVKTIGDSAFVNCSSLEAINIPENVTTIRYGTFAGCSLLKMVCIPENVTSIGEYAFEECSSLETINIPESVTTIRYGTFAGCSLLETIDISKNVTTIEDWAFYGCSSLETIDIPENVETIGNSAFYNCSLLKAISIPENVETIGNSTFAYCTSLETISIPENVTSIDDAAFVYCSSLETISIPENVTSIKNNTFVGCSSLKTIIIPANVTSIGASAFAGCSSLETISIPENVKTIGDSAFANCSSIEMITIPKSVKTIGISLFYNCSLLKTINILGNIKKLGAYMFSGCSSLETINIPESVTTIEDHVFENCSSLKMITIPENVLTIDGSAFTGCTSLETVYLGRDLSYYNLSFSDKVNVYEYYNHFHKYDNGVITIKPTYDACGEKTFTCQGCGHSYTEVIPKIDLKCTIELDQEKYTYSGNANKPIVTVKLLDGTILSSLYYAVTYENNINAGTAYAVVTFNDSAAKLYQIAEGSVKVPYTIGRHKLNKEWLWANTDFTYNGKKHKVTVRYYMDYDSSGKLLKLNRDYTISKPGGIKAIGKYRLTIKGKGNYTGSVKVSAYICPQKPRKLKAKKTGKTTLVLRWKKPKKGGASGYIVGYYNRRGYFVSKYTSKTSYKITCADDYYVSAFVTTYKKVKGKKIRSINSVSYESAVTPVGRPKFTVKIGWDQFKLKPKRRGDYQICISSTKKFKKGTVYYRRYSYYGYGGYTWNVDPSSGKTRWVKVRQYTEIKNRIRMGKWSKAKRVTVY